ncbi:hypothetical protein FKM82_019733 [Ascaphus truei]
MFLLSACYMVAIYECLKHFSSATLGILLAVISPMLSIGMSRLDDTTQLQAIQRMAFLGAMTIIPCKPNQKAGLRCRTVM